MTRKSHEEKNYEVGYGKPPKEKQFGKGQSGNPKGRKKGKIAGSILHGVLDQPVVITKDGRSRKVKFSEAFMHKVVAKALNGTTRDHVLLLRLILEHAPEALREAVVPQCIKVEFV
jgi:hypothetical protein